MANDTPLVKRAYNLGLKSVPNFANLPLRVIKYYERHLHEIPEALARGFILPDILQLLSKNESIVIDACDGTETLANAKEVFQGIDHELKNWSINKLCIATKEQVVDVYQLVEDANFEEMFSSIGAELDKLCLTQHQIKSFCKKHRIWLRTYPYATFFLFKEERQFFIADVDEIYGSGHREDLRVCGHRFEERDFVCNGDASHRVVVPRLS